MAASVKVRLEVDGTPEAVAAVRAFAAQAKAAGKDASSGFAGLSTALGGVTKLFAAYKVAQLAVQLGQFTVETVKAAAEQKDLALSVGTTIKNFSALAAVAKATNTDQSKLVAGLGAMSDRIKDLRQGVPEAVKSFRQLGLGAKDFATDDVVVNVTRIGKALDEVARGGSRGALATDTLGKNGRALLPVFEKLNELGGLEGATAFAKSLGALNDSETAATFEALASELQKMELAASGIALEFAKGFGPQVVIAMKELLVTFADGKTHVEIFGEAIGVLARGFAELVVQTIAWGTVLGDIFTGQFAKARADFERFDKLLNDMRAAKPEKPKPVDDTVGPSRIFGPVGDFAAAAAAAKERLALEKEYASAETELMKATTRAQEAELQKRYATGELSLDQYYHEREKIIDAAYAREFKKLQEVIDSTPPGLEQDIAIRRQAALEQSHVADVQELKNELEAARDPVRKFSDDLRHGLTDALTQFVTVGINQVHSLTDAFRQLGLTVAGVFQQISGTYLVQALTSFLPGMPVKKAGGGLIYGPGTGTSDSIPAMVSRGEYIMPAARVAQPGMLTMLQAMRDGESVIRQNLATQIYPMRGYADGGLVDGPGPAAAGATVGGQIQIGLDDGLVLRALQSPEGQRVLLKVMSKSPRAFGAAIRR